MKEHYFNVKSRRLERPVNKTRVGNCKKKAANPRRVLFLFVMLFLTVLLGGCSKDKKEKTITKESRMAQLLAARAAQLEWTFQFLGASPEESDAIVSDFENLRDIASAASLDTLRASEVWLNLTTRIGSLNDRFSDDLGVSRSKGGLILINTLASAEARLMEECDRPSINEYMQMPDSEFTQGLEIEKNDDCSTVSSDDTDGTLTPENASSVGAQIRACVDEMLDNLTSVDDCQGNPLADGDQDAGIPPAGVPEETPVEEETETADSGIPPAGLPEETPVGEAIDAASGGTQDPETVEVPEDLIPPTGTSGAAGDTDNPSGTYLPDEATLDEYLDFATVAVGVAMAIRGPDPLTRAGGAIIVREKLKDVNDEYNSPQDCVGFGVAGMVSPYMTSQENPFTFRKRSPGDLNPRSTPMTTLDIFNACVCRALHSGSPSPGGHLLIGPFRSEACPQTKGERLRQDCLENPQGPDDGPRPECEEALEEDNKKAREEFKKWAAKHECDVATDASARTYFAVAALPGVVGCGEVARPVMEMGMRGREGCTAVNCPEGECVITPGGPACGGLMGFGGTEQAGLDPFKGFFLVQGTIYQVSPDEDGELRVFVEQGPNRR